MSIIKKLFLKTLILTVFIITSVQSEDLTKLGTFKDWNAVAVFNETGKICFAYSVPVRQSPKASNREARLFVSFRPEDKISDEVSITSGYDFNPQNTILATSGKSKFAISLAKNINGEIINADSMQVFKELKILTARPNLKDTNKIKHHLYGYKSVKENYSVGDWLKDSKIKIFNIRIWNHLLDNQKLELLLQQMFSK